MERAARLRAGAHVGSAPWLVDNVDLLPDTGRVLDVACGKGRHALLLAAAGFAVTAVDRDADVTRSTSRAGTSARARRAGPGQWTSRHRTSSSAPTGST